MKFKEINIISFGALKNKHVTFGENLNVIYGRNESGKTTISSFIEAMLYSFPPRSDRTKYLPWDNSPAAGEMTVDIDGDEITFYREFASAPKGDVTEPMGFTLIPHIPPDREAYRKTIYSPEGKASLFGTTDAINSKIANLLSGSDENISTTAAIKNLEKLRRNLNSGNKLKTYENKISTLEDELTLALTEDASYLASREKLRKKRALLKEYEHMAENIEKDNTTVSFALDKADSDILSQEKYLSQFPPLDTPLPEKPVFFNMACLLSILCTLSAFIALLFFNPQLSYFSAIPFFCYTIVFLFKQSGYSKEKKAFLSSVFCSDFDEYEHMTADFHEAVLYYNSLIKAKSDILEELAKTTDEKKSELYKKILSLKSDIEAEERSIKTSHREINIIKEELEYFKSLHASLSQKLSAIRLAIDGFNHARSVISTDFTPRVVQKAEEYLNFLAPKDGRRVSLSRDLSLTVSDPVRRDISSQSFGFREEMYLCFRLAWSEFVFEGDFPLILDDPFFGSDDYREKKLIDLFNMIARNRQVIIFTNRKNNYYNQLNCNYVDISPTNDV